jgi:TfoX/Sxy family transcriptional regulator of competence genes
MPHDPKQLQAIFAQAAPPQFEVRFKPMFGGILAYIFDKPVASLSDVGLALKMAGAEREALLGVPGAEPLRYAPDQPFSKSYVVVPDAMLGDPEMLGGWIARAAAGLSAKAKAKPKPKA